MKIPTRVVLVFSLLWATGAHAQPAEYRAVLDQMVAEGLFSKVEQGDQHAASYFAREFVWRVNPTCNTTLPGALRKTAGGTNVDGYAEDAIALNGNPGDLNNVIDLVGGAGAPGARLGWGGPYPRRTTDVWECPKALGAREAAYIGLRPGSGTGGTGGGTGGATGGQTGGGTTTNLGPVVDKLNELVKHVAALTATVEGLRQVSSAQAAQINLLTNERLTEDWAARVWAASDPERTLPMPTITLPKYRGCTRLLGCVTLEPQ